MTPPPSAADASCGRSVREPRSGSACPPAQSRTWGGKPPCSLRCFARMQQRVRRYDPTLDRAHGIVEPQLMIAPDATAVRHPSAVRTALGIVCKLEVVVADDALGVAREVEQRKPTAGAQHMQAGRHGQLSQRHQRRRFAGFAASQQPASRSEANQNRQRRIAKRSVQRRLSVLSGRIERETSKPRRSSVPPKYAHNVYYVICEQRVFLPVCRRSPVDDVWPPFPVAQFSALLTLSTKKAF